MEMALKLCWTPVNSPRTLALNGISRDVSKKKVGVLISGSGKCMQLIFHILGIVKNPHMMANF